MMSLKRLFRCFALVASFAMAGSAVHAACSSPAGDAGDVRYASNYNVLAFCDGTNWMSMAQPVGGGGGGASVLNDLTDVNTSGMVTGSILAYNGTQWVVSSTGSSAAEGDRITSGTHAVTLNTSSGYVSLSTNDTTWGYLNSGNSYLPTLVANKVSATHVSATYLQLSSPTTVLACNSGLTGSMRYTSGTMQVCDGTSWGNIGIGVPTGTISAFAATACPSGWVEYTPARGRFLRGIDNGEGNDPAGTRAPGNVQADAFQGHWHEIFGINTSAGSGGRLDLNGTSHQLNDRVRNPISDGTNGTPRTANETRPKNVAVIFCSYAGYESELAPGITTLGGLSDVAVGGAAPGQVLAFDGASWVPSDTTGGSSALGDSIISGTHAVVANTASGIVSLSTAGTTWGYLSSGVSFLPTLMANRVSATNISTTIVDVMGQVQGNTADAVGAPTYSWTGRTTTGMYSPANNQIGFTTGGAETMRIVGNNVGIGTATPSTSLYINGQIAGGFGAHGTGGVLDFDDISNARSGQGQTLLRGSTASNTPNNTTNYWHPFSFEYNNKLGTGNMTQFAIPYTAASGMYVRFRSSGTWTGWHQFIIANTSGNAVVANNMTAAAFLYSSDERLKQNVKAMTGGLAKVDALNPVTFHYTADARKRDRLGFLAQDVEKVFPQAVVTGEDGMKSVDYPSLVPALVGALKELKAEMAADAAGHAQRIRELEAANDNLKAANADILRRLDLLESRKARVK